jgi:hypothetical protein
MHRPLGLPVGSVRALLLLSLAARVLLDLASQAAVEPWLLVAVGLAAAAYFSARQASPPASGPAHLETTRPSQPLGLPAGTIRTLFLLALAVGAFLWIRDRGIEAHELPVVAVIGAFVLGVVGRWLLARARKPEDPGSNLFDHLQALVALVCAAGLVVRGVLGANDETSLGIDATLAAVTLYYFGAR